MTIGCSEPSSSAGRAGCGRGPRGSRRSPRTLLEAGRQVEADFKFYKGSPIWHMIDRAVHFHNGDETVDRGEESIFRVLLMWFSFLHPMDELLVDTESSLASDSAGIRLGNYGVTRRLVAKDAHLGLVERHGELLVERMSCWRGGDVKSSSEKARPEVGG